MTDTLDGATALKDKKLPPGPGRLSVRQMRHWMREMWDFYAQMNREYGSMAYFRFPPSTYCAIFEPELLEEVLLTKSASFGKGPLYKNTMVVNNPTSITSDGADHKRIRKMLQPSFSSKALAGYAETMLREIEELKAGWREGDTVEICAWSDQLGMNIVRKTFFGDRGAQMRRETMREIMAAIQWSMMLSMVPGGWIISYLPLPRNIRRRRALREVDKIVYDLIREIRANPGERSDLISFLVRATDEEEGTDDPLSDEEVRDEAYILFLAGYETSAVAIAWSFFHLAGNPEVREKIEAEVDEVLDGGPLTPAHYRRLVYTRAVMDESLRLTPSPHVVGRTALEDCEIGRRLIPKGTRVHCCWGIVQRQEKHFPEPEKFLPERWLGGPPKGLHRYAYLPFGGGGRNCMGHGFAKMEVVFALAGICRQWRLDLVSSEPLKVNSMVSYKPVNGIPLRLTRRKP